MNRLTQAEVSRRLGVSQQAVSFALSGKGSLSEATRKWIVEEAAKLGYRPNAAARAMQQGRQQSIAVLVRGHLRSFMPVPLLSGISTILDNNNTSLQIAQVETKLLSQRDAAPVVLREQRVDGLIVLLNEDLEGHLKSWLKRSGIPAVFVNRKVRYFSVYPDDEFLGYEATRYLLGMGHQKIAYVGPDSSEGHYSRTDRFLGYKKAMNEAGCKPVEMDNMNKPDASKIVRDCLAGQKRPTAIVAYSKDDGDRFYLECLRQGLSVPGDLSILVISNEAKPHIAEVPYQSLRVPFYQIGVQAQSLLESCIAQPKRRLASIAVQHLEFDEGVTCGPV